MHIREHLAASRPTFSFEFFPPKTPAASEALFRTIAELEPLRPTFVSVTYGAGGSTRELTHELVVRLKTQTSLDPIPHLTCVRHDEAEIRSILDQYAEAGVSNILALRGDPPSDTGYDPTNDHFQHASDLVAFIRAFNADRQREAVAGTSGGRAAAEREAGFGPEGFGIGVAGFPEGHPQCPNRLTEIEHLRAKVDAGADYICTQLFFDNRDFYDFRDRCRLAGIGVPILAGIMPVTSAGGMRRMAELALGARFPAALLRAINRAEDDPERIRRVGVQWAAEQCRDLLDHDVDGLHFYTLNKSSATREVYASLGLGSSSGVERASV